jgi:AcrR family transcriptional regulator
MKTKKIVRKEQRTEGLKNEILDAAVEVFKECGYEKATIKKIAEKADISDGSLYNYFENKRDLLLCLFKTLSDRTINGLKALFENVDSIEQLISGGIEYQFHQDSTLPILTILLHETGIDPEVQKIFIELKRTLRELSIERTRKFAKEGNIRKIDHVVFAILMNAITIGITTLIESGDKELAKIPVNDIADKITDILINGLKPMKTKESIKFKEEMQKN